MRGIEGAVEWLRPLVDSKIWDYCVVWKLGDDPSRFFEWAGCCCIGGRGYGYAQVKEEKGEKSHHLGVCKDVYLKHRIRSKACEALSYFPDSIALYSGIHGEVVISDKPAWLYHANASEESGGTQVLIPVLGGLIELFSFRHIPEDGKIAGIITAHFNFSAQQSAMNPHGYPNMSIDEHLLELLVDENSCNLLPPSHMLASMPFLQLLQLPLEHQPNIHPSFDGSSSSSNFSNGLQSFDTYTVNFIQNGNMRQQMVGKSAASGNSNQVADNPKQRAAAIPDCNNKIGEVAQQSRKGNLCSRNLLLERRRRNKLTYVLYALRALVPNISKMDRAAILGDAVEYITKLQKDVKELQNELKEVEEEECRESKEQPKTSKLETPKETRIHLTSNSDNQESSGSGATQRTEVKVEVNQIGKRDFLVKMLCEKKQGGVGRLIDAIFFLGLQVVDANVTTSNGKVLNIFKVEANKEDLHPKKLRELLIRVSQSGCKGGIAALV